MRFATLTAACVLAAAPALAGRFVTTDGSAGVAATVTDDGCTASVLFDDARVRTSGDVRSFLSLVLPLRIIGDSDVAVEARGFAAGGGEPAALLSTLTDDIYLFEPGDAEDDNWSRNETIGSTRGRLRLVMAIDEAEGDNELGVDSIDLSIENCGGVEPD